VLRLEKKGRGGKSVTVVANLPRIAAFLAGLAAELNRARLSPAHSSAVDLSARA